MMYDKKQPDKKKRYGKKERTESRSRNRQQDLKTGGDKVDSSFGSILFSVFLVALAIAFVFGFKYILKGYHIQIPGNAAEESSSQEVDQSVRIEEDHNFIYEYVMIQSLKNKNLMATVLPGQKDINSVRLTEGEILKVKMRGYINEKLYYLLDNGMYLKDDRAIMPLKEYVPLTGYLSITYISSTGVKLRRWADFDADNIVRSVYVGDKVEVSAKVVTATDTAAFITTDGCYITTDSRYLNDHTTLQEDQILTEEEQTAQEKSTKSE